MTDFFFQLVKEAVSYDDKEKMEELFALRLKDMRDWCDDMLNCSGVPNGAFRATFIREMFGEDSDEPYMLWRYMQDMCAPEPAEEDADVEEAEKEETEDTESPQIGC
jgi:hypothetical protein